MKITLSVGILFLCFANISAEKTITCKVEWHPFNPTCEFWNITIGPNEAVVVETDPADADASEIISIQYSIGSSLYSLPREIFTKFPNARELWAAYINIQEIKPDTFRDAKTLAMFDLSSNSIKYLGADIFKGISDFYIFLRIFFHPQLKLQARQN